MHGPRTTIATRVKAEQDEAFRRLFLPMLGKIDLKRARAKDIRRVLLQHMSGKLYERTCVRIVNRCRKMRLLHKALKIADLIGNREKRDAVKDAIRREVRVANAVSDAADA